MAGRLVVTEYISLDGVVEDPVGMEDSGLGNWIAPFERGPGGDKFKRDELFASDALLLGRRTYEGFAAVWPTVKDDTGFADRINRLPKFVAASTLASADWSNSKVLTGDLVGQVRGLKERFRNDVLVYGSVSVVHALLPSGLIDEYRMMVYPTVLGRGKRLFGDGSTSSLTLLECTPLGSGIVLLRYQPNNKTDM